MIRAGAVVLVVAIIGLAVGTIASPQPEPELGFPESDEVSVDLQYNQGETAYYSGDTLQVPIVYNAEHQANTDIDLRVQGENHSETIDVIDRKYVAEDFKLDNKQTLSYNNMGINNPYIQTSNLTLVNSSYRLDENSTTGSYDPVSLYFPNKKGIVDYTFDVSIPEGTSMTGELEFKDDTQEIDLVDGENNIIVGDREEETYVGSNGYNLTFNMKRDNTSVKSPTVNSMSRFGADSWEIIEKYDFVRAEVPMDEFESNEVQIVTTINVDKSEWQESFSDSDSVTVQLQEESGFSMFGGNDRVVIADPESPNKIDTRPVME